LPEIQVLSVTFAIQDIFYLYGFLNASKWREYFHIHMLTRYQLAIIDGSRNVWGTISLWMSVWGANEIKSIISLFTSLFPLIELAAVPLFEWASFTIQLVLSKRSMKAGESNCGGRISSLQVQGSSLAESTLWTWQKLWILFGGAESNEEKSGYVNISFPVLHGH
jgi:hypothetical protein